MSKRHTSEDNQDASPKRLGEPLTFAFSGVTAPNRFLKAAMTERLSSWSPTDLSLRGIPSANLANVYRRWGEGQYGLMLTGNIMIAPDQLEGAGNPVIPETAGYDDERFQGFKNLATAAKKDGCLIVGQVSHPGRQTEERFQPDPVSASDVQLVADMMGMKFAKPHAATKDEIQGFIRGFTHAAVYLHRAGFDGIQLHGAHGYLLAQFLSNTTNKRTDEYGGSLENRARLIVEIAQSIRKQLPSSSSNFVLGIKVNSVEFQDGGFTPEEAKKLCALLEENEFDFVELSGGTYESLAFVHKRESTRKREAFFIEFAESIVPVLSKTKTYVTGGFKTVSAMDHALDTVDGVGLGRPACQEFSLPKDILEGKVQGAIEQAMDETNFGLTNVAAGSLIRQVGKDQQPTDMSVEKNVQMFQEAMGAWGQKMAEDAAKMNLYGFVDLPEAAPFTH